MISDNSSLRMPISAKAETVALTRPLVGGLRLKITWALVMSYAFLAPLGNLSRMSDAEGSKGITTLIVLIVIGINLRKSIRVVFTYRVFFLFFLLVMWMGIASLFST